MSSLLLMLTKFYVKLLTLTYLCSRSDCLFLLFGWTLRRGSWWPDWRLLLTIVASNNLLDGHSLSETFEWISSFKFFKFNGRVLVKELIDGKETATDLNLNLISFNLDHNTSWSKLIDTFRLSEEHNFELLTVWVVVDVLSKLFVCLITFLRNIDCNPRL